MAGKIFVNYRRDDVKTEAARLHDRLAQTFGAANLFMDADNLLPGEHFALRLKEALAGTDVFLAVIGAHWLDLLEARAQSGERDYVREEIAAALAAKLVVIPVLMDRAPLPKAASLPEDIRELALYHKHDVVYESFGRDVHALIAAIEAHRQARDKQAPLAARLAREKEQAEIKAACRARQKERQAEPRRESAALPWKPAAASVAAAAVGFLLVAQPWLRWAAPPGSPPALSDPPINVSEAPQAGRIAIDAAVVNNTHGGWFLPGAGKTESFKDCADCPEMVVVPAGTFTMGSPENEPDHQSDETQHRVVIKKPFAVGKFAVTFAEWDACRAGGGCGGAKPSDQGWGRGDRPVINVNWNDAKGYVKWLSSKTGKEYRLLSEAEREYVARAGRQTPFWWGKSISTSQANYDGNYTYADSAKGENRQKTVPVWSFEANPWGLYQVHGNVYEWVEDCWHTDYAGAPSDNSAWTSWFCDRHVLRGGSWVNFPQYLRAAFRYRLNTVDGLNRSGFRLAKTLTP